MIPPPINPGERLYADGRLVYGFSSDGCHVRIARIPTPIHRDREWCRTVTVREWTLRRSDGIEEDGQDHIPTIDP